jgi:two-component system, NarL family, response regulator DevR
LLTGKRRIGQGGIGIFLSPSRFSYPSFQHPLTDFPATSAHTDIKHSALIADKYGGGMNVYLVEDSEMVRKRLKAIVNDISGMHVTGEAVSPMHAIDSIVRTKPDAVVLDIGLVGGSGVSVLRRVHELEPELPVIVLTNYFSPEFKQVCLEAGAKYFFDKTHEFEKIGSALAQIASSKVTN